MLTHKQHADTHQHTHTHICTPACSHTQSMLTYTSTCSHTHTILTQFNEILLLCFVATIANFFGTRSQFHGRQFLHGEIGIVQRSSQPRYLEGIACSRVCAPLLLGGLVSHRLWRAAIIWTVDPTVQLTFSEYIVHFPMVTVTSHIALWASILTDHFQGYFTAILKCQSVFNMNA